MSNKETWEILGECEDLTNPALPALRTTGGGGGSSNVVIEDPTTPANKMKINADGSINAGLVVEDIEIGAVEIKNATTDDRVVIKTDGTDMAMVTQNKVVSTNFNTTLSALLTGIVGATAKTLNDVWTAITGILKVGGDVAAGATDSGSPVKVGGKYNASLPTLTDGQRGDAQLDANAKLLVSDPVAQASLLTISGAACTPVSGQATASGDTTIIAAVAGKKIRIYRIYAQNIDATAIVTFLKIIISAGTVNISPATLAQYQMQVTNIRAGQKYYECDTNTLVAINLGATGHVNWQIDYALV